MILYGHPDPERHIRKNKIFCVYFFMLCCDSSLWKNLPAGFEVFPSAVLNSLNQGEEDYPSFAKTPLWGSAIKQI